MDYSKAFSVENGILIDENNGGPFFTGGTSSPVGLDLPVASVYAHIESSGFTLWKKYGAGVNDWRKLSAQDIRALYGISESDVQSELNRALSGAGTGISDVVIFGQNGNTAQNSYVPNANVPSNVVGYPVGVNSAKLRSIFLGNENLVTGNVYIRYRYPQWTGSWTDLYTISLNNERYKNIRGLDISITTDAEISVYTEVALKSIKILVGISGDSA